MPRQRDDDNDEGRFEEEGRPRSRRSRGEKDDEDEERPRRKSRRDEEGDEDDDHPRSRKKETLDRATLRSVAMYQRGVLGAVLVYLFTIGIQFILPPELRWILALVVGLPTVITATVFVFLLSMKVYSPVVGVLLALLTLIPCVGLLVLLIINQQATSILRRHGISVGLLGASRSDID